VLDAHSKKNWYLLWKELPSKDLQQKQGSVLQSFTVLRIKPTALHMVVSHCTTELHPQIHILKDEEVVAKKNG
jgi:hypothetical protein